MIKLDNLPLVSASGSLMLVLSACSNDPASRPFNDSTAPSMITDLAVVATGPTWVSLEFSAPADEGRRVAAYDLRYVEGDEFAEEDFHTAHVVATGTPVSPSARETIQVSGLSSEAPYSFRIRAVDSSGNWSESSEPALGFTKPARPVDPGLSYPFHCPGELPIENAVGGGLPPDAIPSLVDPEFLAADKATYLLPADRVFGVEVEGRYFAFPRKVMNFHEVATFSVDWVRTTVTWCPLTFSFIEWRKEWKDPSLRRQNSFGVAGSLVDNNLVLFDRESISRFGTATTWPQILGIGMTGPGKGECLTQGRNAVDTTWELWRKLHPNTRIVTNRNERTGVEPEFYDINPYERYWKGLETPPEPTTFIDDRLPWQQVVLGVHGQDGSAAVRLGSQAVAEATVGGTSVVFFSDPASGTTFAFENLVSGTRHSWVSHPPDSSGIPRFRDVQTGSVWSLDGVAQTGPLAGVRLAQVPAFHVFWFAWATFFRDTPILIP